MSVIFISCGKTHQEQDTARNTEQVDSQAMAQLQGIWIDEETSTPFFRVMGDSIYYPDTLNIPVKFEIRSDTLVLRGTETVRYPVDRMTKNTFYFHSPIGDVVKLQRSNDDNDTIYFVHKPIKPIVYNEVVKKDTVVFLEGERYRCYIYVNPSKHKVYKQSYTDEGVAVENVYYDNVIHICVYQGRTCLYSHDYSRASFKNIVPDRFLQQAVLSDMSYGYTDTDGFHFHGTVCIPDGASCYVTDICVSPKGEVKIELIQ